MPNRKPSTESKEKVEHQGAAPDPATQLQAALAIFSENGEGVADWGKLNVHGKIAAISGYLGRIPKNGWNRFNNYHYVLESDLVEAIRYYLAAARILVYVEAIREHTVHTFTGEARGDRQRDILTDNIYTYRVTDGLTGETFTFEANGQGSDPRDKGSNKASTGAMKFAYVRLFNISSGEDEPERDAAGDQQQAELTSQTAPVVTDSKVAPANAQRGGQTGKASVQQIKAISNMSNQLGLGAAGLVAVIEKVLGDKIELPPEEDKHAKTLADYLKGLAGEDAGKLVMALQEAAKAAQSEAGPVDDGTGGGYGS